MLVGNENLAVLFGLVAEFLKRRKVVLTLGLRAQQQLPIAVGFSFFRKKSDTFFLKAEISSQQYTRRAGGATRSGRGCFLVCAYAEGAAGTRP